VDDELGIRNEKTYLCLNFIQRFTYSTTLRRHCGEHSKNKIYKKKPIATKQTQTHTAFNNEIASPSARHCDAHEKLSMFK
jgi:hypothetical protein